MSIFASIVLGFALGVIFGGRIAWKRGLADKDWLWWSAFGGKR